MNIRSNGAFWPTQNRDVAVSYSPLETDESCEIAIIGGGVTGALMAHALRRDNRDVVLLEGGEIGGGSTAISTALLIYQLDTDLCDLIEIIGERDAVRAYQLCHEAIFQLEELTKEIGGDCDFRYRANWYLSSGTREDDDDLRREFEALSTHGFAVEFLERQEIAAQCDLPHRYAIRSAHAAEIDVFRFTAKMFSHLKERGLRLHENTAMTKYSEDENGARLRLQNGATLHAKHVVFASGYAAREMLREDIVQMKNSFVVVGKPLENVRGWPEGGALIWETARPYFYMRLTPDGRPMIGGEDVPLGSPQERDAMIPEKSRVLQEKFRALLPHLPFEAEYSYAGEFGETRDGLAYIGASPEYQRALFALGYGGNGIVFSVIAADLIAAMLRGENPDDARLFRFGR